MNTWQVKAFFRAAGLWSSSPKILLRTHFCPWSPPVNTTPVTSLRSLALCSRPFHPPQRPDVPVISASRIGNSSGASSLLIPKSSCVCISRAKTRKSGKKSSYQRQKYDLDSDEDEEEMKLEVGADFRDMKARVPSLRMDALLKAGLNMSRNKVEAAFYASKIRVNGEKLAKKSHQCHEGDEIDVIKGVSHQNPENLHVSRVVVMALGEMDEEDERVTVKLRRYPHLLIECYRDYKPPERDE